MLLKEFPVLVSSLALQAELKSLKGLLSMQILKQTQKDSCICSTVALNAPGRNFISFFLSLLSRFFFFNVSSFSQPVIDSKCNHITHSFLWKAPFLMIWQSVDTDCFQKKFQSLFPQLPQAPMINDTCHSVTDKQHRWERQ